MNYEKSLFGYTSVSFIETAYDSIPDIDLSSSEMRTSRRPMLRDLSYFNNNIYSPISKTSSYLYRSPTQALPTLSSRSFSIPRSYRPLSSKSFSPSSFLHDQPGENRYYSSTHYLDDPYLSTRFNTLRSSTYIPPVYNRFYYP